jgi:hypothetical protein
MNWYWPDHRREKWIKKIVLFILNALLNATAKAIWFKITNADIHDKSYSEGHTEADRIIADTGFLRRLLIDCEGVARKAIIAYVFYFSVRLLGKHFFLYGEWWKNEYFITK